MTRTDMSQAPPWNMILWKQWNEFGCLEQHWSTRRTLWFTTCGEIYGQSLYVTPWKENHSGVSKSMSSVLRMSKETDRFVRS